VSGYGRDFRQDDKAHELAYVLSVHHCASWRAG
jgi:hypothetical protein